jgi:hypothetical protein
VNRSFAVTVTLNDRFGNVAAAYGGTVHFASSDPLARLPANYTFTAVDAGTHTFSATLMTIPRQSITVSDVVDASLSASRSMQVNPPLIP